MMKLAIRKRPFANALFCRKLSCTTASSTAVGDSMTNPSGTNKAKSSQPVLLRNPRNKIGATRKRTNRMRLRPNQSLAVPTVNAPTTPAPSNSVKESPAISNSYPFTSCMKIGNQVVIEIEINTRDAMIQSRGGYTCRAPGNICRSESPLALRRPG